MGSHSESQSVSTTGKRANSEYSEMLVIVIRDVSIEFHNVLKIAKINGVATDEFGIIDRCTMLI